MLIQVSLKAVHKTFAKKAMTLTSKKSPLGVSLRLNHTNIGLPWGFNFNFLMSIPFTFMKQGQECNWFAKVTNAYYPVLTNAHILPC